MYLVRIDVGRHQQNQRNPHLAARPARTKVQQRRRQRREVPGVGQDIQGTRERQKAHGNGQQDE